MDTFLRVLSACIMLIRLSIEFCTIAQSVRLSLSKLYPDATPVYKVAFTSYPPTMWRV